MTQNHFSRDNFAHYRTHASTTSTENEWKSTTNTPTHHGALPCNPTECFARHGLLPHCKLSHLYSRLQSQAQSHSSQRQPGMLWATRARSIHPRHRVSAISVLLLLPRALTTSAFQPIVGHRQSSLLNPFINRYGNFETIRSPARSLTSSPSLSSSSSTRCYASKPAATKKAATPRKRAAKKPTPPTSPKPANMAAVLDAFVATCDPVDEKHMPSWMMAERTRLLTSDHIELNDDGSCVIYWMQRDVRSVDNWALLFASHVAETANVPLRVMYVLQPTKPVPEVGNQNRSDDDDDDGEGIPDLLDMGITERHGKFLLGGLELVHKELQAKQIPLDIILPPSHEEVGKTVMDDVVAKYEPQVVISDFSPLRHFRQWMECQTTPLLEEQNIPLWQVDAHNVVPVWHAADKRQVGARTLRPKINKVLDTYLQKFPKLKGNAHVNEADLPAMTTFDLDAYTEYLKMDASVPTVAWQKPGTDAAKKQYAFFIQTGLPKYDSLRNDPNQKHICSNLSPWLNHGHVSFHRLALATKKLNKHKEGSASFIEEGLIRRELSDNFLYYSPHDYDDLETAAGWAFETLEVHSADAREHVYSLRDLEQGKTHDDLWNAAQLQVVREGQMHGFLRMYWAKKILEWTESPLVALKTAQYFNDKYALDGRDPNGFIGVGWSIMGLHDQGWKEREVFGKIRYMNYAGCKRKFNVASFVDQYDGAAQNAAVVLSAKQQATPSTRPKLKSKPKAKAKRKPATTSAATAPKRQRKKA